MSVFEWKLVGPKGQGHTYVGAVATNFLMTVFIIMSEKAPSYISIVEPDTNVFALLQ